MTSTFAGGSLGYWMQRIGVLAILSSLACAQVSAAESNDKISLQASEPLFAVLTAINLCGYDAEFEKSDPVREQIRKEATSLVNASYEAIVAKDDFCKLYKSKQQPESSRDLAQYVSLAVSLNGPPFALTMKQQDLPPDVLALVQSNVIPAVQSLYEKGNLHSLWEKFQPAYEQRMSELHKPVADMIFATDLYLRLPMSGYLGRKFVVYVEPLAAPGQINARNYGDDYYMVVSPSPSVPIKTDAIRHTYLHYILDPLALRRSNAIKRMEPLLDMIANAPLEQNYKQDMSLMLVESLIRAIEARNLPVAGSDAKAREMARSNAAQVSMEQGFILTRYFYEALAEFEKGEAGFRDSFGDMLVKLDIARERKRASNIKFSSEATPETVRASKVRRVLLLDLAEQKLAQNDPQGARRIAQEVLDNKSEDPARALMILGKASTRLLEVDNAQSMFERALEIAKEPRTLAWSHIYLARILDLRCQRDTALSHYRAALSAGDPGTDTKSAAEKGIATGPERCAQKQDQ
jgi:tetratricopeptide (TPR) repeat protein